ncbi:hypothetical protein SRHO_G00180390 [Serrasalmus rhombeus]
MAAQTNIRRQTNSDIITEECSDIEEVLVRGKEAAGVVAQDGWAVSYNSKSVCALKGSALSMECAYTPPSNHSVQKAFWTKELVTSGSEVPDLLDDPEYRGRVQYLGDEHHDCTLRFKNVTEKDQSKYYFTFITDQPGGKYQGEGGVDLSVTDLQVEVPERVIEGDKVTLTCKTTCSLTVRPTFTWYRNGHPLSSSTDQLHLQPVSSDNKDRYHCGVLGQNSPEVILNVRYGPKTVSVSISPSGEIVEGSSVTLTCSSDANPPVQNYTWFKGTSSVGKGETYTMKEISSVDSGEYKCRSSNEHGEKLSEALTLNVLYPPKSVSVSISPSGEIVEGSSVTLTCSSDANPPVDYNWIKGTSSVGKGETYTMKNISSVNSGEYKCRSSNEHGEKLSEALTVNVLYPPKSVSVSISPSGEIEEGSSVNLTCSSDANPPVEYNWFKGTSIVGKGETYTMKEISSVDSGEYKCKSSNEHGEKFSEALTLNVLYPPKNISVSISPSGEIVEGRSVTLTCSSDANPPVDYNWIKGTSSVGKGETYTMKNISSVNSGEYKCRSSNEHGEKLSEALTVNVLYPPKSVSVSISPSGEIEEGSSVNLTCSSDANPPVEYNWFKGTSIVGKGETYTMKEISSVDSGEYKCRSSNKHGEKLSEALTLNVLYPPKNISVSISPSGEIMEGSSVTLTCSSDANPPVDYNWIKGTSSVGKGETYTMKNISSVDSGEYKCRSSNEHGEKLSEALTVNVLSQQSMTLYVLVGVGLCGAAVFLAIIVLIRYKIKKKKRTMEEGDYQNVDLNAKDDTYTALDPVSRSSDDVYSTLANVDPNAKEDTYTALHPMSRSSDDVYNTLATVHSSPSDDLYSALDPQSRSPEYDTLAVSESTCTDDLYSETGWL